MKHKQVFAVLLTLTMAACNIPAAVLADDTAGACSTVHVTSADDFGNKVVNAEDGTYDTKLVNVCKALYNYWEEADKYSKLP